MESPGKGELRGKMEMPVGRQSFRGKKMTKQLTGKRDDTPLHSAASIGDHVTREARDGDRQFLLADGRLNLLQEQRELSNLGHFLRVGNLLVVGTVAARVPVQLS